MPKTITKSIYGQTITRFDYLKFVARVNTRKQIQTYRREKARAFLAAVLKFEGKVFARGEFESFLQAQGLKPGTASGMTTRLVEKKVIYPCAQDGTPWSPVRDGRKVAVV